MGVIHYVACKQCKVKRDLDKFYTFPNPMSREEALEFSKQVKKDSFRFGLLIGFMGTHMGHECVMTSDLEWGNEYDNYENDTNFWS